jgi:TolB protein
VGGDIYTIGVNGENLQRVADGMDPTWSPDGQQFAFIRWAEPRGVWVANADGSGARRVFDWSEPRWTSWSPDGTQILFSRPDGGRTTSVERCWRRWCFTIPANPHWRLGVVRPSDGSFYEPPASNYSRAPDWSPAGGRLVYADEMGLRVQSADGAVSYLITDDGQDTSPLWSPDGTRIAFVRRQHDHWELYVVDADGRNLRRLTDTPRKPNGEVAHSVSPAWSPDGATLAFLTDRTGRWEIWRMRANGSKLQPMFDTELDGLTLDYGFVGERAISWRE